MRMKAKWLLVAIACLLAMQGRAGDIRDAFKEMPDSLLPSLSENNRLDMIDFIDSGMKAEVSNLLNGKSEMTELTDSSLTLRVSEALKVRMLLLPTAQPVDSCSQVICLLQTYGTDSLSLDTRVDFYSLHWQRLEVRPALSPADEQRIESLKMQTILKWEEEILKDS